MLVVEVRDVLDDPDEDGEDVVVGLGDLGEEGVVHEVVGLE